MRTKKHSTAHPARFPFLAKRLAKLTRDYKISGYGVDAHVMAEREIETEIFELREDAAVLGKYLLEALVMLERHDTGTASAIRSESARATSRTFALRAA